MKEEELQKYVGRTGQLPNGWNFSATPFKVIAVGIEFRTLKIECDREENSGNYDADFIIEYLDKK